MKNKLISIAMSGGVDSSVSAWILKKLKFKVTGFYITNFLNKNNCDEKNIKEILKISKILNIDIKILNFNNEYKKRVFKNFLKKYENGLIPNPDIICNKKIKFNIFLRYIRKIGFSKIATGHYAKLIKIKNKYRLLKSKDKNKDQTYFLNNLNQKQLSKIIFPIGNINKVEVRKIAKKLGFFNFNKKDSTGICFIENINFKNFLNIYLKKYLGYVLNKNNFIISIHDGIKFYTIGQKFIFKLNSKNNKNYIYYKNIKKNTLNIIKNYNLKNFLYIGLIIKNLSWISSKPKNRNYYSIKIRHNQVYSICMIKYINKKKLLIIFNKLNWGVNNGQSVSIYDKDICLGGGIISSSIF